MLIKILFNFLTMVVNKGYRITTFCLVLYYKGIPTF